MNSELRVTWMGQVIDSRPPQSSDMFDPSIGTTGKKFRFLLVEFHNQKLNLSIYSLAALIRIASL